LPAETSTIIDHLEEKERKEGALPPLLKFYQGILRIQAGVESKIASLPGPGLSSEAILRRLERGKSLVAFDELAIDWPLLRKTFKEVTAVFAEYKALFAQPPEKIGEPGAGRLLTKKEVKAWFKATGLPAAETANGGSESLFSAIVQAAFKPFLASHASELWTMDLTTQQMWDYSVRYALVPMETILSSPTLSEASLFTGRKTRSAVVSTPTAP